MGTRLKGLLKGTRVLESRLTTAFEQAARTVVGTTEAAPLEIIERAVDEVAGHVQAAGRGRYTFPFNSVTITFAVASSADEARFLAICEGPPSIDERISRRLVSAGCPTSEVDLDVTVAFIDAGSKDPASATEDPASASADPASAYEISLARVDEDARAQKPSTFRIELAVTSGATSESEYAFTSLPVAIGRGRDVRDSRNQLLRINDVAFIEGDSEINRTVSRRHARIVLDEATERPRLIDDNSAQGTSIVRGGRGIAVPRGSRGLGLKAGDEIVLGQARLKVTNLHS